MLKWFFIVAIVGSILGGGLYAARDSLGGGQSPFRQVTLSRGEIISTVNSTGTIQPVLRVQIGAAVSGPVAETFADFNSKVKKGDVLAKIDPRTFRANVARDEASLAYNQAEVSRTRALLEQASNNEKRALDLRKKRATFISDSEMDQFKAQRASLEAQLEVAKAGVKQAEATLGVSRTNLEYTIITSPVDGIVIDRQIDPGQTVAATFQTPILFVVAPDMEKLMNVYANVDEADIGLIRQAQTQSQPVFFTVDAYPGTLFQGTINQIRLNPTTTQNVVTYTVVVSAPNHELKLLPGMTANLSFQIEKHSDVLRIPNAALRFYPNLDLVRPEDRALLKGGESETESGELRPSALDKSELAKSSHTRHVWIQQGKLLQAVEITTGISDNHYTELVSGNLENGSQLVTGLETSAGSASR